VLRYNASVYAKHISGPRSLEISIRERSKSDVVLASQRVELSGEGWQKYTVTFDLANAKLLDSHRDDVSQARTAVAKGCHLIISLEAAAQNSRDLRRLLAAILETDKVRGLVCSGGDTALLVCSSLGAQSICLHHEILPGLPWGILEGGSASGLPICPKAGGFGSEESLCQVADFLATRPPFRWRR